MNFRLTDAVASLEQYIKDEKFEIEVPVNGDPVKHLTCQQSFFKENSHLITIIDSKNFNFEWSKKEFQLVLAEGH